MRRLIGIAFLATLAAPSIVTAQTPNPAPAPAPQSERVRFPAPAGYCAIDRKRPHEAAFADTIRKNLPNGAALAIDCKQAERWRQAGNENEVPNSLIITLRFAELNADKVRGSRSEAVAKYCSETRSRVGEVLFTEGRRWLGDFQTFAQAWRARNPARDPSVSVGLDEFACYAAQGTFENNKLTGVTMTAATVLRGQGFLIMALDLAGGLDANRLAADHARLRAYARTLVRANTSPEQSGINPAPQPPGANPPPVQPGIRVQGGIQSPKVGARL